MLSEQFKREIENYLATSDITFISHTHGRERREERDIKKRELQEAIKYGRRESAVPGRKGDERLKFTHRGVVYITDATMKHEITSWRISAPVLHDLGDVKGVDRTGIASHTVIVVDASGSMRKTDVLGFSSRTKAVYETICTQFLEPQIALSSNAATNIGLGRAVVSLLEMSETTRVIFDRQDINNNTLKAVRKRGDSHARSHGHYCHALDELLKILLNDINQETQVTIIFLSDGSPSDHITLSCPHGYKVWSDSMGTELRNGKKLLNDCPESKPGQCRRALKLKVKEDCVTKINVIGDMLGRDRVKIVTAAFGPATEDYSVLKAMAAALPRNSFQMLGLSASCLTSTLTSLSSDLTSLRTEMGSRKGVHTQRNIEKESKDEHEAREALLLELRRTNMKIEVNSTDWYRYYTPEPVVGKGLHACGVSLCPGAAKHRCGECRVQHYCSPDHQRRHWSVHKTLCNRLKLTCTESPSATDNLILNQCRYNPDTKAFQSMPSPIGRGIAMAKKAFAEGAERVCFRCTEFIWDKEGKCIEYGPPLVCKESKVVEDLHNAKFHELMCKLQSDATDIATQFNIAVGRAIYAKIPYTYTRGLTADQAPSEILLYCLPPDMHVSFIETYIYEVLDMSLTREFQGHAWMLVEPKLDGEFRKWNNNNGRVNQQRPIVLNSNKLIPTSGSMGLKNILKRHNLDVIDEDEEEESDDEESALEQIRLSSLGMNSNKNNKTKQAAATQVYFESRYDLPQTLSHYSYSISKRKSLMCDIQGMCVHVNIYLYSYIYICIRLICILVALRIVYMSILYVYTYVYTLIYITIHTNMLIYLCIHLSCMYTLILSYVY